MRKAEEILADNFDAIRIAQLFTDDECNIIKYNEYAREYIEERSKFKIGELPFKYALSKKLLDAMVSRTPCYDAFFVNFEHTVAEDLHLNNEDNYYAYYAEYEPVYSEAEGKTLHYFIMKDVTEFMMQNFENHVCSSKFHELMRTIGVAYIDFYPDEMKLDIVGGRDNYNEMGISLSNPMRLILHPDDMQKGLGFFRRIAKNRTRKHSTMVRIYSQAIMDYRYYTIAMNPIYKPDGAFVKFSGFAMDVSERIELIKKHDDKANLRLNKLEKEKTDVEKSKSHMDQMLSVMGHDLRSPLSTILGFSELMVNVDTREEREEMYGYIQKSVGQMMVLVNSILESTRLDAGTIRYNITTFDVFELLKEVYNAHKPIFKDIPVELVFDYEGDTVEISSDKARIVEILNNYLSNAVKYTKEGSVTITGKAESDGVYFHVVDTGAGIAKKDCEKAFERYEMLGSEEPGTGLGLYICRELAKGLGGKVGCVSDKGKGCDFWVWLPR